MVKLSLLNNAFRDNATKLIISQHARTHILTLVGNLLMSDTSASKIHLMYHLLLRDLNYMSYYN